MPVAESSSAAVTQVGEVFARSRRRRVVRRVIAKLAAYIALTLIGLTMLVPLLWMLSTSLKEPGAVFAFPPTLVPNPVRWRNYIEAWNAMPFGRFYLNSLYVGTVVTVGQVATSSMAAYAFARLRFPFRDKLFFMYLATMMIPGTVTMVPIFIFMKRMGLVDTYTALIVPGVFSAFGTFMLRQFFLSLPRELEEAAKIDGCSLLGIFWRITLPLSKPALATLVTLTFMGSWSNFLWPLIITNSTEMWTLPIGLQSFQGQYQTNWTLLMAASLIVLLPVTIVFLLNQRFFIEGIQLGAIKG